MEPFLLVIVAIVLLAFGVVSRKAERSVISSPMVFVLVGYAVSERGLGWLPLEVGAELIPTLADRRTISRAGTRRS